MTEQQAQTPTQPPVQPPTTPEQQEFLKVLNDLMTAINELSFTAALLEEELLEKYPELKDLSKSVKKVVKAAWSFVKTVQKVRK